MTGEETTGKLSAKEAARIDIAIRRLPPLHRRMLMMSRIEGRSHSDIAAWAKLPEAEVRAILTRVLIALARGG